MEEALARKIRFRKQRIYKIKIVMVFVLFISVLLFGLIAVDLNKSYVMYGEPRLELVQIESVDQNIYRVSILNSKISLNLKYIKRDLNSVRTFFNFEK